MRYIQEGKNYQVFTDYEGCNKILGVINSKVNWHTDSGIKVNIFDIHDYQHSGDNISDKSIFSMRIALNPRTEPTPELRERLENVLDQVEIRCLTNSE